MGGEGGGGGWKRGRGGSGPLVFGSGPGLGDLLLPCDCVLTSGAPLQPSDGGTQFSDEARECCKVGGAIANSGDGVAGGGDIASAGSDVVAVAVGGIVASLL